MKSLIIFTVGVLISLTYFASLDIQAQDVKKSTEQDYNNACSTSIQFVTNDQAILKDGRDLKVNFKKGELIFSDTLVEEEHMEMREYEVIGINEFICMGLIRENRLTESKFILVDLDNGSFEYIDSYPIISKDAKYLVTIAQPEGDDYKGLKLFRLKKGKLIKKFKDDNPGYYYSFSSGKWCDGKLYIIRVDMFSRKKSYWLMIP